MSNRSIVALSTIILSSAAYTAYTGVFNIVWIVGIIGIIVFFNSVQREG